jgi:hypothetical protein
MTTHWYADEGLATGADDGTSPADAFRTVKQLVEHAAFNAANVNKGWIRRTSSVTMGAIWNPADDGTAALPIQFIGWPRPAIPNTTITQADWTNGSTQVDNVVGITLDREKHAGRYVTAPDGFQYLITRVGFNAAGGAVADMLLLDREYAGVTVTTTSGKFQIEADEDYDDRPTAGKAPWDGDAIDLPIIDGNDGNFYFNLAGDQWYEFRNLELRDSGGNNGIILTNGVVFGMTGCLISTDQNKRAVTFATTDVCLKRIIIEGSGAGASQFGVLFQSSNARCEDMAVYNMGDIGILTTTNGTVYLDNVNVGVEVANGDDDISVTNNTLGHLTGKDVKLGGTNGYVSLGNFHSPSVHIENYQKVLGDNKTFYSGGEYISTAVSGETPNKKLSDTVLKITPNVNLTPLTKEQRVRIPLGIINMDAGSQTVKFWAYNDLGVTVNDGDAEADIYLEAEYVDSYDDTTEYTIVKANSTDSTIADAADADDWDSFSVAVNPATESLVYFNLVVSIYDTDDFFIDPQVVIT